MIMQQGNVAHQCINTAITDIAEPWQADFRAEIAGDNFLRGGKSILLRGEGACDIARQWHSCLVRANFEAYRTTPLEAVRRSGGLPIIGDEEARAREFVAAETVLIDDFFDPVAWTPDSAEMFTWYFRTLHRSGAVILLSTDEDDPDLDNHGTVIGSLIEKTFEVIAHVKSIQKEKAVKPKWTGSGKK